jgi:hypothetical protein
MTDRLTVAAIEVGNPVALFVLSKSDNRAGHTDHWTMIAVQALDPAVSTPMLFQFNSKELSLSCSPAGSDFR